jgi:2-keto-3-deoxy-L-rhamnonate aldolase RhmA
MTSAKTAQRPIRQRALAGEPLFGAFLLLASPVGAELAARTGFDWLIVDLEHGAGSEADLLAQLYAIETTGASAIVRPASGERLRIGRALDLGAAGIMVPRLDTVDDVREAISYLRWPPDGARGLALLTRGARLGAIGHTGVRALNADVLGIIQIESRRALENADAIAAIDGADVLFVGPTDLSHSLGIPGQFDDPAFAGALERVVEACRSHGKSPGILLRQPSDVGRYLDLGYRFIGLASDAAFVADGARAALANVPRG